MNKKYIYLSKEEAKKGIALVYEVTDKVLSENEIKNKYGNGCCLYIGEDLPHYITYIEDGNTVREATEEEKLKRGDRGLHAGEIYENGRIKQIEIPEGMINPIWDNEKREWKETATLKEIEKYFMDKLQEYMDNKAKTYGFDSVFNAASYIDSKIERFKNDSRTLLDWRDSTWDKAYTILEDVLTEKREIPTLEELLKELPQLEDGGR